MPSLEQLQKLLMAEPNDPFVLYALAQEHAKLGHVGEAIGFFDRCLAVDSGYCYAYFHKARVQHGAGDVVGAIATVEAGLQAAQKVRDSQALGELSGLLDEWS
jgi:tetratricopeptide (TPR) repeat protein